MSNNPFELVTASKLGAKEAIDLWCDDARLDRVKGKENCFINGHRGTGKSMLFRILQYDCQQIMHPEDQGEFLAVYIPVRDTEFITEEMELFQDDSQRGIISESHFCILVTFHLIKLLKNHLDLMPDDSQEDFCLLARDSYMRAFKFAIRNPEDLETINYNNFLSALSSALLDEQQAIAHYIGLRMYQSATFDGPLFMFDTLLGPLADFIKDKTGKTIYILIDDGDDLPESHTVVLNTWIARRRPSVVFKISTMFGYKTYNTRSRSAIQHPHDFFQLDIATRFLIKDGPEDYVDLLRRICEKRLTLKGINTISGNNSVDEFFPEDPHQRSRLDQLSSELGKKYSDIYEGRAIRDYVYRHLTSEYIKELHKKRSTDKFIYSGFRTIAILSSGMVRDFIIYAQRMYDNTARIGQPVLFIPPNIQSEVVRKYADDVLEDILNYKQKRSRIATQDHWILIRNLIENLGNIYKNKMLSDDSERRVFSFAFQDEPSRDIIQLLEWAVEEGYMMKGFISRKEGTGRRVLYVLTRRLAPAFTLDVSAYSGYLSLTTETISSLLKRQPARLTQSSKEQLSLFEPVEIISDSSGDSIDQKSEWKPISPELAGL